nr:immunoglobulin heavy chain junction region [Mus musculus]MBK4187716.1 immunoglobulin heavy chain junction region [Mus musculus]MBK4187718.1 immunoglobulin heavy chain junction region [Mus musculus]MBK4190076.1 immunoglobulin heavy chain junction region [Mus musculus]
CTGDDGHYW